MRKLFFLFCALSVMFFDLSNAQTIDASEYFPLQIGNTWTYNFYYNIDLYHHQWTVTIIDTMSRNGDTWYLFDNFFSAFGIRDSLLFRIENNKVYHFFSGKNEIWFDFDAMENDIWKISSPMSPPLDKPIDITFSKKNYDYLGYYNCCYFFFETYIDDAGCGILLVPNRGCVYVDRISVAPGRYIFSHGIINGIQYADSSTSVELRGASYTTQSNHLSVYPNPFNSSIKIQIDTYLAQETGYKKLFIYDRTGRKIRTLDISSQPTAPITWYGENDQGIIVASGLYIVSLFSNQHFYSRKILFLK
ncbi:hypothetical protein JW935_00340 [candidate division KSB1 bacterium]|nr:hypothetical protein [candidate division KSB1 bacterium]